MNETLPDDPSRSSWRCVLLCCLWAALLFMAPRPITEGAVPLSDNHEVGLTSAKCLATAIYHEARGESKIVQRAVVDTIHNRASKAGSTACGVVAKKSQFSWYKHRGIESIDAKRATLLVSTLAHPVVLKDENYRFFYSGSKPYWAAKMMCKPIGKMNFCKLKEKE